MSFARTDVPQPRLFLARAGARAAFAHALVVVAAFLLAGYLAELSLTRISQGAMRDRIRGEAASLMDEYRQKGADHLPYTVAKRQRLWRGFDYRLEGAPGADTVGRLPLAPVGWSNVTLPGDGQAGAQRFLTYGARLPNGARLVVGQNLAVEAGQTRAITWTLALCGALGVVICVGLSYLVNRAAWRRVAAIAKAATRVSEGGLEVRATGLRTPPRDDIDHLGLAFNAMLDRIGALIDQVRQVSNDVAHDMRTPLTRHRHRLERLRAKVKDRPDLLAEVQGLENDVDEVLRTFDALLRLSEIEATTEADTLVREDLAEVVGRVAEAYRPDIEDSGRRIVTSLQSAAIDAHEALLAQAVANLLENALRHTPPGATIALTVEATAGSAVFAIRDDGPGIPAALRETVLRPFVRLEPSRRAPGSGLGLSIVAAVAARHGATLSLEDARPGLQVRIAFPPSLRALPANTSREQVFV